MINSLIICIVCGFVSAIKMNEQTKYIIEELNKILNKNFSISTFENLTKEQLLKVICDVLVNYEVISPIDVQKNFDIALVTIIEALQTIKYAPTKNVPPEDFRNGIALGNRSIIQPILYWLVLNPNKVRKRAYLSKYVEKIECPIELLDDNEVRQTYIQYEQLIEEFWKAYMENEKVKKQASEVKELYQDIVKMEEDTSRLRQRIEQQKGKIENISNKEIILSVVKSYRNELNEHNNLEQQILDQKESQSQIESEIKELRNILSFKQTRKEANLEPLQQITNELRGNKILESKLPIEMDNYKRELDIYETVSKGPQLTEQEIHELNKELSTLNEDIQVLIEQKLTFNETADNQLTLFRNQAAIISNKKQEISIAVMDLKNQIADLDIDISEKEDLLVSLVGGPLLQGENLKKYVAKLRETNIIYKEYKNQIRSFTNEIGVLSRTLDVLKSIDPSVETALNNNIENLSENLEINLNDKDELKIKVKKLATQIDQARAETAQLREELRSSTNEMQPILEEYNKLKNSFEDITKEPSHELQKLNNTVLSLEEQIKTEEKKWKNIHQENERRQELLVRLNEDLINATNEFKNQPTQADILKEKLAHQELMKENLQKELDYLESQKIESRQSLEILDRITKLLQAK